MKTNFATYSSKIGRIKYSYGDKIHRVELTNTREIGQKNELTDLFHEQIGQYLSGFLQEFKIYDKIELKGSDFQIKVWQELMKIPYGQTLSYKDIAEKIGNPKAFQAIGAAIGANPLMIIIPCHRVIKADGSLGGYHYGIETKKKLLKIERII